MKFQPDKTQVDQDASRKLKHKAIVLIISLPILYYIGDLILVGIMMPLCLIVMYSDYKL